MADEKRLLLSMFPPPLFAKDTLRPEEQEKDKEEEGYGVLPPCRGMPDDLGPDNSSKTPPIAGPMNEPLPPIMVATMARSTTLSPPWGSKPISWAVSMDAVAVRNPLSPKARSLSLPMSYPMSDSWSGLSERAISFRPLSVHFSHIMNMAMINALIRPPRICDLVRITSDIV